MGLNYICIIFITNLKKLISVIVGILYLVNNLHTVNIDQGFKLVMGFNNSYY